MQLLLIEDDDRLASFVAKAMREEGHHVVVCRDGAAGLATASSDQFDVILLDRMLPKLDGLQLLEALRQHGDTTPVIILSALGEIDDRVRGLRSGGDDYLPKPFSVIELAARVDALGRRKAAAAGPVGKTRIGDLVLDPVARLVWLQGSRVELTNREFRILECLVRNAGRVVTRSMLLEQVWDYNFDPQTNIIDQHVSRLRHKLDDHSDLPLIETVRGAGYSIRQRPQ